MEKSKLKIITYFTAIFFLAVLLLPKISQAAGEVATYSFNEGSGATAADSSGNSNTGTISSATWTAGKYGNALSFDGINDRVEVPAFDPPHQGTVMFWFNPSRLYLRQRLLGGHDAFEVTIESNNLLSNQFFAAGSTVLNSSTALSQNQWYHAALTYDFANSQQQLYLNGVLNATGSFADDDPGGPFVLSIGVRTGSAEYFQGLIDEVRIYNRVLSQAEIQSDMNTPIGGTPLPPPPPPPPIAGPLAGQIMVDPSNSSWLVYNQDLNGDGKRDPFFMAGPGDPEDFLYRGTLNSDGTRNGDQMMLINKLKGTGANSIYMQAIRSHGGDGDATHNPFINNDPTQGVNTAVLDQWETWFSEMDNNGIVIYFFFYDDSASIWNTGDTVGNEEKIFIQTIINRFKHHKNLIWVVAEEYQEVLTAARVSNIAKEIRTADNYNHVIAVHKLPGLDFSEFANDSNIEQFAIQYNVASAGELHSGMITASNNAAGRYNLNMSEAAGHGNGAIARQKNWAVAMGGAYVMALEWDIANTSVSDLQDAGRLVSFMQSTNFNEMAPHDELKFGGTLYALAKPQDSYIVYSSNLLGNIGLKSMTAGTYEFRWYDVVNGTTVTQTGISVAAGDQSWTKPAIIGNELAVYIKKTGSAPPSGVVFPGVSWQTKTPQELGLDGAKLNQLASNVGGDGVIVKGGYIVKTWGSPASKNDWASAFKPVVSTMLFFAVNEGKLSSVDALIDPWWNGALIAKDKTMKFRHLADMTSGYARGEAPGAAWAYNDYAIKLYVMTLFDKVYQETANAAATKSTRLGALQFQDGSIFSSRGGYGVDTSPRDFARIGWFWLNKGNWNGTQLLPKSYFDNYMKVDVPKNLPRTTQGGSDYLGVGSVGGESDQGFFGPGMYGFNWWFNAEVGTTGMRPWPDAPTDMFMASGHGGIEQVVVYPSQGIVAAAIGNWGDVNDLGNSSSAMNINFKLLKDAVATTPPDTTPPAAPSGVIVN